MARTPKHRCYPLFSEEDADLRQVSWYADKYGYARGTVAFKKRVHAHKFVMERKLGRPLRAGEYCDHEHGDRLDNRREKLHVVSWQQNSQNRLPRAAHGFRGATFIPRTNRWQAYVGHNGRCYYCGSYETGEEAAAAAAAKRRELGFYGEAVA